MNTRFPITHSDRSLSLNFFPRRSFQETSCDLKVNVFEKVNQTWLFVSLVCVLCVQCTELHLHRGTHEIRCRMGELSPRKHGQALCLMCYFLPSSFKLKPARSEAQRGPWGGGAGVYYGLEIHLWWPEHVAQEPGNTRNTQHGPRPSI